MNIPSKTWSHQNSAHSLASIINEILEHSRKEFLKLNFSPLSFTEHRIEYVVKIKNVSYINDSLATNVHATWYALESLPPGIIWIAGGVNIRQNYDILVQPIRKKVKTIILLGKNNHLLKDAIKDISITTYETSEMKEAVLLAYKLASPGEIVLLSPACPSFDLFKNYKERGTLFKKIVLEL
ncbi:MAG: hypothetical protein N2Z72_01085 [Bacteroidales bacterium]|nr:hypothetical protein [Bacteroidales bacterium]